MSKIKVKILGTGAYLPSNPVASCDLEKNWALLQEPLKKLRESEIVTTP